MNMKIRVLLVSTVVIALFACNKEYKTRVCGSDSNIDQLCVVDSTAMNVRIQNYTGYPLCNFRVVLNTNDPDSIKLGRVEEGVTSCYMKQGQVKQYPIVNFKLGVREFRIVDSLNDSRWPYQGMLFNDPGFYTLRVETRGTLDTAWIYTAWVKEPI